MDIKRGITKSTREFWPALKNGYLDPMEICERPADGAKVNAALLIIIEFQKSCEVQIKGFIQ